jgi:hypothetical protein
MGIVTGAGDYPKDSTAVIGAIPNSGYRFVQWSDGNTQNPRTVAVTGNTTYTAIFGLIMHHLTVTANNTAMGIVTGSGDYPQDSTTVIGALANPGYRFVQWHDGNIQNPRTLVITSDTVFTAIFSVASSGLFNVTVLANNATMGTVTGGGDYVANAVVTIHATPNSGYRFVQWNDGNTDNPRTITVTQDIVFTAIFNVAGVFRVSVFAGNTAMGTVTGSGDYAVNAGVTIRATPNSGYRFVQWNDGNTDNPRTITVTQDTTFTAVFNVEGIFHVSVFANNTTMGTVGGSGDYVKDNIAIIAATSYSGYRFVSWNDGNTDNPRMLTVTQDTMFIATFEINTGITDIESSTISVYPNPTRDNIHIVLPENVSNAVFTLYDMQGKALIQQQISNQDVVSVDNLAAGIYIYNVRTEKGSYTGKIIRK